MSIGAFLASKIGMAVDLLVESTNITLQILRGIAMLFSMSSFWDIVRELLDIVMPDNIVEIGALSGASSTLLCEWVEKNNKTLQIIEPKPDTALLEVIKRYRAAKLHVGKSLDRLQTIDRASCFFVDGDHNYFTVYNELKLIHVRNEPDIVFLHDVSWPWARRDHYYDVNDIPPKFLHEYTSGEAGGIVPGFSGVLEDRGFTRLKFAKVEGGPRNGVLTAVEDFVAETDKYHFFKVDAVFGLGILIRRRVRKYNRLISILAPYINNPVISMLEKDRVNSFVESFTTKRRIQALENKLMQEQESQYSGKLASEAPLYLNLIKKALLDLIQAESEDKVTLPTSETEMAVSQARKTGLDWPKRAFTMIGVKRLNNVQFCVEDVLRNNIPGDFIETGVWRGGCCIFMRAALKVYGITDRKVWVADSFKGLPKPNPENFPHDQLDLSGFQELAVSRQKVESNFQKFDLLDEQVQFLEGWFEDTLPTAPIEKLAVLRLDGDLYKSTMDALETLYPKLSPGGYIIIDDYGVIPACKQAVHDYREKHGITEEIIQIDQTGVYWQRAQPIQVVQPIERVITRELQPTYTKLYDQTLQEWLFYHQREIVLSTSHWMGIQTLKNPLDTWIYQEIIYEIRPDIIIEIGSRYGGSTLYFAHLLELIGKGHIISVDIKRDTYEAAHPRIIDITGDSGSSEVFNRVKELCQDKKVLLIHDGDHHYEAVLKDLRLYGDLVSVGSYMIVEDGIVDLYPANSNKAFVRHFIGKGPLWAIEQFVRENLDYEIDLSRERYQLTQSPHGFLKRVRISKPAISVIVVVYNMQREAPRTLLSLSPEYQGVSPESYEVIVVENGSTEPLDPEIVKGFGPNFRYFYIEDAAPSPAAAVNFGVRQSSGNMVCLMVDGARILSPGILKYALRALRVYQTPLVSTLGWQIGPDLQYRSIPKGYSSVVEDKLLADIKWPEDGYKLFAISVLAASSANGWFAPIFESNCIFLLRYIFDALGGFDERFDEPGGGYVNLDFYYRAAEFPGIENIILLGEGSFHQIHGGISTNSIQQERVEYVKLSSDHYKAIAGRSFSPPTKQPEYWGHIPTEVMSSVEFYANRFLVSAVKKSEMDIDEA